MPRLPATAWFELAPDWVCEILSPATAKLDRMSKIPRYAANAVAHCGLIDPDARTLEAFERRGDRWLLLASFVDEAEVPLSRSTPCPFRSPRCGRNKQSEFVGYFVHTVSPDF